MARNSTKTGSRSSSSKSRGSSSKSRGSSSKSRGSSSKRSTSSKSRGSSSNGKDETERYRQAAEDALQQLDWTIGYLHGIKKTEISKALAQNRSFIRRNLMGMPEEPLPDQETDET
jgi:hypothetical protein